MSLFAIRWLEKCHLLKVIQTRFWLSRVYHSRWPKHYRTQAKCYMSIFAIRRLEQCHMLKVRPNTFWLCMEEYYLCHLWAVEHGCNCALASSDIRDISLQGHLSLVWKVSYQHVYCLHKSELAWKYHVCHLCALEHGSNCVLARSDSWYILTGSIVSCLHSLKSACLLSA